MDNINKGDVLTIIGISDFMETTTRASVKATGITTSDGRQIFTENKKGARKKFTLRAFGNEKIVFKGEVPFKIDSEVERPDGKGFTVRKFSGNACFNFVGDPNVIKDYVSYRNLNTAFTKYDAVILVDGDKEIPLYPNVETSHAVVQRIRENVTA